MREPQVEEAKLYTWTVVQATFDRNPTIKGLPVTDKMHLRNAPIKEALIDIKVFGELGEEQVPTSVCEALKPLYPEFEHVRSTGFQVEMNESRELTGTSVNRYEGVRAFSIDRLQVVQFRSDGFTFSRLGAYQDWNTLRQEAFRLWQIYASWRKPVSVRRVAVRYINEISIELPMSDFGDYLTSPPVIPAGLPQALASFLMRIVIPNPANGATAVFTQSLQAPSEFHAPIILDIDVFKDIELSIIDGEYWNELDILRDFKNEIFFRSITDRTKDIYK